MVHVSFLTHLVMILKYFKILMFYYLMSKNITVYFYTSKWFTAYTIINNKFIIYL